LSHRSCCSCRSCRDWSEGGILILNFVPAIYNKARILWFIQVSTTKSQKQGTNETMLASVNASGNYFPGVFVFPRVNVNLDQSARRFIPLAHKTGWMTSELLLISLQHLEKQISWCSPEKPILLIMDNHVSHIRSCCWFCQKEWIVLFTIPPHTSHVTQPLERCLFGPWNKTLKQNTMIGLCYTLDSEFLYITSLD
jgi:hypothetical protein